MSLKITLEVIPDASHGTLGEASNNARRCLWTWARANGFKVTLLSVQTKGYAWVDEEEELQGEVGAEGERL